MVKGKWTTHKIYKGEEALRLLDEILKKTEEQEEQKEKPNGKDR